MPKVINETGNRYGRLTVIKKNGSTKRGAIKWLCLCDCGNEITVIGNLLRRGSTKSCGCLRQESIAIATEAWRLPKGEAALNWIFDDLKRRAQKRNYVWDLTKEQVKEIILKPCFYCGVKYSNNFGDKHGFNGGIKYNGLDRIDNSKGYTLENVVPCCKACNISKNDRAIDDFRNWVSDVYHHWAKKE